MLDAGHPPLPTCEAILGVHLPAAASSAPAAGTGMEPSPASPGPDELLRPSCSLALPGTSRDGYLESRLESQWAVQAITTRGHSGPTAGFSLGPGPGQGESVWKVSVPGVLLGGPEEVGKGLMG